VVSVLHFREEPLQGAIGARGGALWEMTDIVHAKHARTIAVFDERPANVGKRNGSGSWDCPSWQLSS
jgi:hypothetical protein